MVGFMETIKTIYSAISVAGTVGTGLLCPPCTPIVGGVFSLGGAALNAALDKDANNAKISHEEMVKQSLNRTIYALDGINGTLYDMKDTLRDINGNLYSMNGTLLQINEITHKNNELLHDLKEMIKSTAEENRKLMKGLKVDIAELGRNMEHSFTELRSFHVEKDFDDNVRKPIDVLWKLMEEATESQTKRKMNAFIFKFKKAPPRLTLLEFVVGLNTSSQNPIKAGMDSQVFNSKAILERYLEVLSHAIFKVYALEGFYYGLDSTDNKDNHSAMDEIAVEMDNIMRPIQGFVASYKMETKNYWPERIQEEVGNYLNNEAESRNTTAKVDWIQRKLDGIHTTDVFAIYSYDESTDGPKADQRLWSFFFWLPAHNNMSTELLTLKPSFEKVTKNNEKTTRTIVLRSTRFHEMSECSLKEVRSAYRGYAYAHKDMFRHEAATRIVGYASQVSFINNRSKYTRDSHMLHGFVVDNIKPITRFTNNGFSLLREEGDLDIMDLYHGLTWA